jgi:hypothetical protein
MLFLGVFCIVGVVAVIVAATLMFTGPQYNADSAQALPSARTGRMGEATVGQAHGKYYEACSRGNMYCASATGLTPTTAISGTTSAPLVLYNPLGSGKRLAVKKVSFGQAATGTLGTGVEFHCGFTINGPTASQVGVLPTGTAVTPLNLDQGAANNSVATVLSTATLSVAAKALYPFCQQAESVGGTTAVAANSVTEDVDGNIILEPGAGWTLGGVSAAGSSPLVDIGIVWEEIPIG